MTKLLIFINYVNGTSKAALKVIPKAKLNTVQHSEATAKCLENISQATGMF